MPGGRPTEYGPDVIEKGLDYLENYANPPHNQQIPTIAGLCKVLNRAKSTVYKWAEEENKKEFSDLLANLKEIQELGLVNSGLDGTFNSPITKLILMKHGYKEESSVSGPDNQPLIPQMSDAEIARRALFAMTKMLKDGEES